MTTSPGTPPSYADTPTLLVKIFGRDRPGITAGLFETLAAFAVEVVDIEQLVTRGRITLCALVTAPGASQEPPAAHGTAGEGELRATVHGWAETMGLEAEIISGTGDNQPRGTGRSHVTVLGRPLTAGSTAAIAASITATGGNIDRIFRLAKYPVTAVEFDVSGAETPMLRTALALEASRHGVDIAVVASGLQRRAQRLVVMDVDSTLIQDEVIELFAAHAGCEDEVAEVTARAMRGELDFEESLHARVALLEGLDASVVDKVRKDVRLTPGARTLVRTLKRLGYQVGIVSGGFTQVTDALQEELGLDFAAANTLEVADGKLTGRVTGDIVDREGKARLLRRFASEAGVPLAQTVAIGDGANDLGMLNAAGLGVAFNAKPVVREAAHTAVNVPFLDTVLYLLGVTREEVEAADCTGEDETAQDGATVREGGDEGRGHGTA
ncbi:phosphoserine phosphatase SerB [Streptomyces sp. WMMB 322]|uniref:phosphoserine phosphatase SerB n=1 Tax=Streptomyces sp. WMMB 322 TaxID=1286821 RepID=UPI000823975C|nr:phosphoserine phosphatase SerB [Streptomyces sp. WMMB 322]SCK21969.1 phosphoserine phosphatase [Streptomyces sp. WMMB 322]